MKKTLEQVSRVRDVARLATPIPALGLRLRPGEFTTVTRYRLGCPVFETDGPCPDPLLPSDQFGDHALCCGHGGERISRHNQLRDPLYVMAAADALNLTKESKFLLPGLDRRPADVLIPKVGWWT